MSGRYLLSSLWQKLHHLIRRMVKRIRERTRGRLRLMSKLLKRIQGLSREKISDKNKTPSTGQSKRK
jgi:hypothetical protein